MIDFSPLDSMNETHKEFFLRGIANCKNMIKYYNFKDWKVKKGKLGNWGEEFIGSIVEKWMNPRD